MKIHNIDTLSTITLWHDSYLTDVMVDIVGNHSSGVTYNAEEDRYEADTAEIDYWTDYIRNDVEANRLISAAKTELGNDEIRELDRVISQSAQVDLGDQPNEIKTAVLQYMSDKGYTSKCYSDNSFGFVLTEHRYQND